MAKKILIIDDDADMCVLLTNLLSKKGYLTDQAHSGSKGLKKYKEDRFDLVLCDYRLGDMEGSKLLNELKKFDPDANVVIFTGYEDVKTAVNVIKSGAFDYMVKPLVPDEVINTVERSFALTASGTNTGSANMARKPAAPRNNTPAGKYMQGVAANTKELYRQISLVAPTDYSVILYGESGTGKEVMAQTIHEQSKRRDKPFVALDCGTLSKELAASELFGYVKGAFTGAITDKEGHFEMANGGTIFLDEIANLSYEVQATLLRVIQERKSKRVGGMKEIDLDVRIIVASNENLKTAYQAGKFREDLYHRFNEFSINIPPLRDRQDDIPLFAQFFLDKANDELQKDIRGYEPDVVEAFKNYSWPGNLREMRNVVRKSALLETSDMITTATLPSEMLKPAMSAANFDREDDDNDVIIPVNPLNLKSAAGQAEYQAILNVLKKVNFNKTKAAEMLNIDRKTLYNKLKNFELI